MLLTVGEGRNWDEAEGCVQGQGVQVEANMGGSIGFRQSKSTGKRQRWVLTEGCGNPKSVHMQRGRERCEGGEIENFAGWEAAHYSPP